MYIIIYTAVYKYARTAGKCRLGVSTTIDISIVVDTPRTAESDRSTCSKLIGHDCALWRTQARVRVVVRDYTVRKRVLSSDQL